METKAKQEVTSGRARVKRFLIIVLPLMAFFQFVLFFPYAEESFIFSGFVWYLALLAKICGWFIRFVDPTVTVQSIDIIGRFPLRIVLDCAALDAQALFVAAVLAFPAPLRQRAAAALVGWFAIYFVNVIRIVLLYWVGVHAPAQFKVMHEEVLTIAMVLIALLAFLLFIRWVHEPRNTSASVTPAL